MGQEQRYPSRSNMRRLHVFTSDDREEVDDMDVNRMDPECGSDDHRQTDDNRVQDGGAETIARL